MIFKQINILAIYIIFTLMIICRYSGKIISSFYIDVKPMKIRKYRHVDKN